MSVPVYIPETAFSLCSEDVDTVLTPGSDGHCIEVVFFFWWTEFIRFLRPLTAAPGHVNEVVRGIHEEDVKAIFTPAHRLGLCHEVAIVLTSKQLYQIRDRILHVKSRTHWHWVSKLYRPSIGAGPVF